MDKESQKAAVQTLSEWSRWLIGIDLAAAAGCVIVLQGGVGGVARVFLILAIGVFALALLCAVLLSRVLASVVEQLPLRGADGNPQSIYAYRLGWGLSVAGLAHAQLVLLVLAGLFFLGWVIV
ncbi:hypothetical protein [Aquisalimonas sp.]|uniref:hypothetical protein n=1 Tax=Aquisalimonas sp. TaxID=1872621 RepID=UPI0025C3E067|nr:hypothetical protein [Aquisalimonas sp.]